MEQKNNQMELKVYQPESKVFAINRIYKDGKPTNSITIYEAVVESISISYNEKKNATVVEYWLKTPKGESWGDCVQDSDVHDNFDALVQLIKPAWLSESNTFGDE
jgi:hypothetical protein